MKGEVFATIVRDSQEIKYPLDMEQWAPDSTREDLCDVIAFPVEYYVFKQDLAKPLQVIYRAPHVFMRYDYPAGTDFRKYLTVFDEKKQLVTK